MGSIAKAAVLALAGAFAAGLALAQDAPVATTSPPAASPATASSSAPAAAESAPKAAPAARPATPHPAVRLGAASKPAISPPSATLPAYVPALPVQPWGARLAAGEALPRAELEAYIDGVVRDAMAQDHIAGVAVSIVQNGQVAFKKGYGFASLSPARKVDPDRTLFRLGDLSKTFTWIALMREVEAGRIRLEAPVNLYLPEPLQVRDQGYHTPVKVSNLLDHSAGFEDRTLGHLYENRVQRERPLADYLRQERPRRVHEPGAVSSYSNYGAALAGEAVSYVAQKPFERLAEDEIFVPLRLAHTTFRENRPAAPGFPAPMPPALVGDISDGYRWTPTGFQARPYEFIGHIAPAASASSTAGDMARYMVALLNGGALDGASIYGPRAAQAFRTPLRATPPGINGWAGGFVVYELPGGRRGFGHPGQTLSFASNLVVIPDLNLGIFVAANTESGRDLASRLPARIIQEFYTAPQAFPPPGNAELGRQRGQLQGYYISTQRAYGGLEAFVDRLREGTWTHVSADGHLATVKRDSVAAWSPDGDPAAGRFVSTAGLGRLDFDLERGGPARFVTSDNFGAFERTDMWRQPGTLAVLAGITALAAAGTLGGVLLRNRREFRETSIQSRLSQVQNAQAALWLTAIVLYLLWASKAGDDAALMYSWPGPFLVLASACALVAAALTLGSLVALPAVWRGGRRVDSWSALRKLGFSVTVLVYAAFSVALYAWGALSPWSG